MPLTVKNTVIVCTVLLALCISGATYFVYNALTNIAQANRQISDSIGYVSSAISETKSQLRELEGFQNNLKETERDISSLHNYLEGIEKAVASLPNYLGEIEKAITNIWLYR